MVPTRPPAAEALPAPLPEGSGALPGQPPPAAGDTGASMPAAAGGPAAWMFLLPLVVLAGGVGLFLVERRRRLRRGPAVAVPPGDGGSGRP
jgi:hypothetical protein